MEKRIENSSIALEINGFIFSLEPFLAINGELKKPREVKERGKGFELVFEDCSGSFKIEEYPPKCLRIEAGVEKGYSKNGILAKIHCKIEGYRRLVLYHFTYDPEKYFGEADTPYEYPCFREPRNREYSAWSFPAHLKSLNELPKGLKASQILLEGDGCYAFLLAVSNEGSRGFITEWSNGFSIVLDREAEGKWSKALIAVFSLSEDPYTAIGKAYEACFEALGKPYALRKNKTLAEPFRFLGWCSWNSMWFNPNEQAILKLYDSLVKSGIKPGFILIDDGWQDELKTESGARAIKSFKPDPNKFPNGFKNLVKHLKDNGVKYVGLWHTLNLHWNGVAKNSELFEELKDFLVDTGEFAIPDPNHSFDLYNKLYEKIRSAGFDFVKVDNQSFVGYSYSNKIPIEGAARKLHEGLEGAAYVNGIEVLNCMAQQPENQFNWLRSTVSRNCIDYIVPHKKSRNKLHLYFNAYNSLWMSQIVWPDWDMFQSHDPWALQQAVARAVSGGPVYITDNVGETRPEIVKPLAFQDSSIPLPDHPGLPSRDVVMRDPYNESIPLKIFTRITVRNIGVYGVVASFNINKNDEIVEGSVSPSDALLKQGEFVSYEYFSGEAKLVGVDEKIPLRIEPMGVRLHIFSPVKNDLAAIGLKDVYLMPRGIVSGYSSSDKNLVLEVYEPGEVLIWSMRPIKIKKEIIQKTGNLYFIKSSNTPIEIKR